jgi:hypothetical protein
VASIHIYGIEYYSDVAMCWFGNGEEVLGNYTENGASTTGTATVAYWYTYASDSTNTTIQQIRADTNGQYIETVLNSVTTTMAKLTSTGINWYVTSYGDGSGLTNLPLAGVIGGTSISQQVAVLNTNTASLAQGAKADTALQPNGVNGTNTTGTIVSNGQVTAVGTSQPWLVASADGMSGCPSGAASTGDFANVSNRVDGLESSYQPYSATNYAIDGTVTVHYADGPAIKMTMTNDPTVIVFAEDYPDGGINRVAINVYPGTNTSLGFVVGNVTNPVAPVVTNVSPAQLIFRTVGTNLPFWGAQVNR